MAKRLRGWELEMQSGRRPATAKASKALEKAPEDKQSPLANKLLLLWAKGVLSATLIREIADLAIQDGAKHQDLVAIAQTGNWGQQPGNAHKQILNHFCSNVNIATSYEVEVPCIHPKTSKDALEKASIFLPHMMFYTLGQNYPSLFHELFDLGNQAAFWQGVRKTGDEKLVNHPMSLEKDWENLCIPLYVHGDGVDFSNDDNIMVYSWGPLGSNLSTLFKHWMLASFPKSCATKQTWDVIWTWLHWSFTALAAGKHPSVGPGKEPLEKGSIFAELAGKPLHHKNYKGILWSVIGDHDFFSNTLGLPHWNSKAPCWECDAQNCIPCTFGKGYKEICLEKQRFKITSHVRGDPLHILFCKGLYGHLIGSILHYCCWKEGPGQRPTKKPTERLAVIFNQIQIEYSKQDCKNRLTNLKISMFSDAGKPWANWANLGIKAGESKHLLPALLPVLRKLFEKSNEPCEEHMLLAATSLEKLVDLWDQSGTFLTQREYEKSLHLGGTFLNSYSYLNNWSLEKDRKSFHIVPKHHSFLHLLWGAKHLNPRIAWCFAGEDFVGQISKLGHSVSMGVSATRLSLKIAPKYRILIHLHLTRSMKEVEA